MLKLWLWWEQLESNQSPAKSDIGLQTTRKRVKWLYRGRKKVCTIERRGRCVWDTQGRRSWYVIAYKTQKARQSETLEYKNVLRNWWYWSLKRLAISSIRSQPGFIDHVTREAAFYKNSGIIWYDGWFWTRSKSDTGGGC